MTFQALTAVTPVGGYDGFNDFDPSDEGEIARIKERTPNEEDPLDEYENSFLLEAGLDDEFFRAN